MAKLRANKGNIKASYAELMKRTREIGLMNHEQLQVELEKEFSGMNVSFTTELEAASQLFRFALVKYLEPFID